MRKRSKFTDKNFPCLQKTSNLCARHSSGSNKPAHGRSKILVTQEKYGPHFSFCVVVFSHSWILPRVAWRIGRRNKSSFTSVQKHAEIAFPCVSFSSCVSRYCHYLSSVLPTLKKGKIFNFHYNRITRKIGFHFLGIVPVPQIFGKLFLQMLLIVKNLKIKSIHIFYQETGTNLF